ncbi:AraC-type DNA-binding protein [Arenibacter nanhaiticus]|uniref:AraC-type DNA-binding protein n=1 Tax=Arenibacter nanhaiticus TaxID=558155 RepID=A0A1M6GA59_9FLAO|nr:helix-turn-helix domain-containing protein [Arenibacter nanhaiticus]SHJ06812.1 AraC-type DNA-binding protein [Arenibacter nanhaiticus]
MSHPRILTIHQFEQDIATPEFYCNTFKDHIACHHGTISKPHKHDFYVTVIFTEGEGIHEIDFHTYPIRPGSVFFLKPGQTHHWNYSKNTEGYIFLHSENFYVLEFLSRSLQNFPFYYSAHNTPYLNLNQENIHKMVPYFQLLKREFDAAAILKKQKIIGLIDLIYIDLSRLYLEQAPTDTIKSTTYIKKLRALEKLIENQYLAEKSPAFYADLLNITPKHLNRITQTTLGKTTVALITDRVLLEAKRMLVYSNDSFTNIARHLGYEDYAYFSKLFKQKTGLTPSQFKNTYL